MFRKIEENLEKYKITRVTVSYSLLPYIYFSFASLYHILIPSWANSVHLLKLYD